ncbi:MAG: isoprenylcysteine carboxylmethyltransferase family protein [Anaerolinea sp.]|nr:isoprenylcysteine carboxylmethyltransferase family protein [Anaerolinea sp.]
MSRAALFVVIQFVLLGTFALLLLAFPVGGGAVAAGFIVVIAAFLLIALGILEHMLRNAAIPNITPTPNQNVGLVDTGVYKYIRHPIYSGVIAGTFGAALAHGHIVPLLFALVFVGFFSTKARFEESMLRRIYPQYAEYMTRTGRFVPGINLI